MSGPLGLRQELARVGNQQKGTMADETTVEAAPQKNYVINYADGKSIQASAESIAWTENGEFILLMDGETTKHVVVAANVIAVTEK